MNSDKKTILKEAKLKGSTDLSTEPGHPDQPEQMDQTDQTDSSIFPSIGDKWEVQERLGEGGMSVVYKVRHRVMGKFAAAKLLHKHLVHQGKNLQRFHRESIATSSINHENIINVIDCGVTDDSQPYMVMDYIEGESLADVLKRAHSLDPKRAMDIFKQICAGMNAAHVRGIVHRDLKPSNVMLLQTSERADFVKIVDFGIAKILVDDNDEARAARHHLTETGEVFGSPLYMSPEQCGGSVPDARSDIYSMGCLMYEALAGKPPLMGQNHVETLFKQMHETPEPLPNSRKDPLVGRLNQVIAKAMAKAPSDRYQNIQQMLSDLELTQSGTLAWLTAGQAFRDLPNIWTKNNQTKITQLAVLSAVAAATIIGTIAVAGLNSSYNSATEKLTAASASSEEWWQFHVPRMKESDDLYRVAFAGNVKKVALSKSYYNLPERPVGADIDYVSALCEQGKLQFAVGKYNETLKTVKMAQQPLSTLSDDGTNSAQIYREKFKALGAAAAYLQNAPTPANATSCVTALATDIATQGRRSAYFDVWMQASGELLNDALNQHPPTQSSFHTAKKLVDQMISLCDPTNDFEKLAKCYDAKGLLQYRYDQVDHHENRPEKIRHSFTSALEFANKIVGANREPVINHILIDQANTTTDPLESFKLKLKVVGSTFGGTQK